MEGIDYLALPMLTRSIKLMRYIHITIGMSLLSSFRIRAFSVAWSTVTGSDEAFSMREIEGVPLSVSSFFSYVEGRYGVRSPVAGWVRLGIGILAANLKGR